MMALTLFYFKVEPKSYDDIGRYWKYIEILVKEQVLGMPTIPLKFE